LQSLGESLNRDRERRINLERTVADIIEAPDPKPVVETKPKPAQIDLDAELDVQKRALLALELKLRPEHPDVRKQRRAVEELESRIATQKLAGSLVAEPAEVATPVMGYDKRKRLTDARTELDNLDRQIQGKLAEESRLQGMVAMYQARIQAAPIREAELAVLTRDYETLQQTYRTLLEKKEESQISANLEKRQIGEQFKILDPARMPERPASPNRPQLSLLAFVLAIAVGFASAGAAEYFDRTLRSEADVRAALNLMVLATVPHIRDAAAAGRRLKRNVAIGVAATAVLVVCATVAWRLLS
jgi:uncharacterized protein involved in exopolysaccharide biosynthesis